jgi:dihydrodipicolinate synthase/N-acetylneuraminate lyase
MEQISNPMKLTFENFRGSWAGLPVAWTSEDQFDESTYRGDVGRCCRLGVPGVYSGGTTGEFYAMEFDEFQRVARATIEEAHAAGTPAMIGITSTYTLGAARRAAYAAEVGADAVQVALPYWMEVPDASVLDFFREVSRACGHLPLSVYETRRTKKALTIEQHRAIKMELPNYLMVKSNSNTIGTTPEGCAGLTELGINVFGDEGSLWPLLGSHGMNGCCSSFVYYVPDLVLPLNLALAKRDWAQVALQGAEVKKVLDFVVSRFVQRGYWDSAMDRLGGVASGVLRTSLYCRGPYAHATRDDVQLMRKWYQENLPAVHAKIEARLAGG